MRSLVLVACLVVLQVYCARLPCIGILSSGYDIFYGNPHASGNVGRDPGFKSSNVFAFTWNQHKMSADRKFEIPDNMNLRNNQGCRVSFESQEVRTTADYLRQLNVDVDVSFGYEGQAFSASTDYKSTVNESTSQGWIHIESKASCIVYDGALLMLVPPPLNANFKAAVMALPDTANTAKYVRFFEDYGTHYVDSVHMGAKYGYQQAISTANYDSLQSEGINVQATASLSGYGIAATAKALTNAEQTRVDKFKNKLERTRVFVVGSKPPRDADGTTWSQNVISDPQPVTYHLAPMDELFNCDVFPCNSQSDMLHLNNVMWNVRSALNEYCDYLRSKGKVMSCAKATERHVEVPAFLQ